MEILLQVLLLVLGFVMLIKGADWFVEGASKVADRFGIPQIVIGLTICAMGTSLPEASVSVSAALKGAADITIGNVVGSNIANVLLILGITSLIRPIPVKKNTMRYEIPFTIVITVLLAVLGLMDEQVNRIEGIILWAFMIVYLIYLFVISKTDKDAVEEGKTAGENESIIKMIVMILIGAALIVLGGNITVDAATKIALAFGMSERLVGLTIVAFGTSLPELVTSATAAIKGKSDIAIGNIVGSNIFNILFVAGTTALITPVPYSAGFMIDTAVVIAAIVLLFICVLPKKKLGRIGGLIMLLGYAGYFVYLFKA